MTAWVQSGESDLAAHTPALRRYFSKRIAASEIDDLVQEVFLNMQARRSAATINNIEGYLFSVAAHVLTRHRERISRNGRFVQHPDGDEASAAVETLSPERVLLSQETLQCVIAVLESLPARTRDVFMLHRFEEMSYAAIASRMGLSVSAVEKHIMNALKTLKTHMEP